MAESANRARPPKSDHPCVKCGACCAFFRVAFYWREGEATEHKNAVPKDLWEDLTPFQRCMKGTSAKHQPKCVALKGTIGELAYCSIYENRSSTCKAFKASYEDGTRNPRCDEARAKHGLRPLTKQDYPPAERPRDKDADHQEQLKMVISIIATGA